MLPSDRNFLDRPKLYGNTSKTPITDFINSTKASASSKQPTDQTCTKKDGRVGRNRKSASSCPSLSTQHDAADMERKRPERSVSFGTVQGIYVPNIARSNKNVLWFSKEEYNAMRNEAVQVVATARRQGVFKESSTVTSRGLEQYVQKDTSRTYVAKNSVLHHHDLAMYAIASTRSVSEARQRADQVAKETFRYQSKWT